LVLFGGGSKRVWGGGAAKENLKRIKDQAPKRPAGTRKTVHEAQSKNKSYRKKASG